MGVSSGSAHAEGPVTCWRRVVGGPRRATPQATSGSWGPAPAKLKGQPAAGGLVALDLGIRGVPEPRFAG